MVLEDTLNSIKKLRPPQAPQSVPDDVTSGGPSGRQYYDHCSVIYSRQSTG
ncbi:hypothetical protein JYU34_016057 [Plutella xylostella]|uniref:Uncharacterized protein n=1 Tax=Plutella xylostella TaxID=51655 RepID=A0ABQ7Q5C8_PLUXY|nr:hypothetical protein JYU34_016057 [Plutella xylostella]